MCVCVCARTRAHVCMCDRCMLYLPWATHRASLGHTTLGGTQHERTQLVGVEPRPAHKVEEGVHQIEGICGCSVHTYALWRSRDAGVNDIPGNPHWNVCQITDAETCRDEEKVRPDL